MFKYKFIHFLDIKYKQYYVFILKVVLTIFIRYQQEIE